MNRTVPHANRRINHGMSHLSARMIGKVPLLNLRQQLPKSHTAPSDIQKMWCSTRASSSAASSPAAVAAKAAYETRLAGRQRFYLQTGIVPVPPPPSFLHRIQTSSQHMSQENTTTTEEGLSSSSMETVSSPISAGVDGSPSGASGVVARPLATTNNNSTLGNTSSSIHEDSDDWEMRALIPHVPGTPPILSKVPQLLPLTNDWYGVTLDGRALKTPQGQLVRTPSASLSMAVAAEWNAQAQFIQPPQMPLHTLVCTVLDQTSLPAPTRSNNSNNNSSEDNASTKTSSLLRMTTATSHRSPADTFRAQLLNFLSTDTMGYAACPTEDRVLFQRQQQAWQSLRRAIQTVTGETPAQVIGSEGVMWAQKTAHRSATIKSNANASSDETIRRPRTIRGLPHSDTLLEYCHKYVHSLDAWHLTAMHAVAAEAKSFWIAWGALEGKLSVQEALQAARVEEEFQIENWGLVEGGHDYDRLNASIQIHSAVILKECLHRDCLFDLTSP
jgi:ATP synthase mitochondrial F1 complex assembly factor 2